MITTPEGFHIYYALQYQFRTSHNEAEYEAIIGGLLLVQALKLMRVKIKTDSQLVVDQLTIECETHEERLKMYKDVTEGLLTKLTTHESNEQIENLNHTLLDGLRKRLEELGGTWVEQLEKIDKNFLEERRDVAYARMAEYQQAVKQYQDKRAKVKHLLVSYIVLRDQEANRPTEVGKLAIKWEGPYKISEVAYPGTYWL
nr:uncharacterized protein LOC109171110 [Ipomoea batatas]